MTQANPDDEHEASPLDGSRGPARPDRRAGTPVRRGERVPVRGPRRTPRGGVPADRCPDRGRRQRARAPGDRGRAAHARPGRAGDRAGPRHAPDLGAGGPQRVRPGRVVPPVRHGPRRGGPVAGLRGQRARQRPRALRLDDDGAAGRRGRFPVHGDEGLDVARTRLGRAERVRQGHVGVRAAARARVRPALGRGHPAPGRLGHPRHAGDAEPDDAARGRPRPRGAHRPVAAGRSDRRSARVRGLRRVRAARGIGVRRDRVAGARAHRAVRAAAAVDGRRAAE